MSIIIFSSLEKSSTVKMRLGVWEKKEPPLADSVVGIMAMDYAPNAGLVYPHLEQTVNSGCGFFENPLVWKGKRGIGMAEMEGSLWKYNLCKVLVVDVTDDYRLHQPPLPSTYYPVLQELWLPRHKLDSRVAIDDLIQGYLYDWHERPMEESGEWYVGVVDSAIMHDPAFKALFEMCPPIMAS